MPSHINELIELHIRASGKLARLAAAYSSYEAAMWARKKDGLPTAEMERAIEVCEQQIDVAAEAAFRLAEQIASYTPDSIVELHYLADYASNDELCVPDGWTNKIVSRLACGAELLLTTVPLFSRPQ
jgi:hypothetical protein